ncbi:hypothetical protein CQA81_31925, partial [Klebsiella pneumoniae]
KVLAQTGLTLGQMDVIELNEAFAAQALAVTRDLGLKVLAQTGLTLGQMDVIELNEAFAAQALAVTRDL